LDTNLATSLITASSTALVAIVAILSNNKRLDDTNSRLARLETKLDAIIAILS
jgi:hypothetical protein